MQNFFKIAIPKSCAAADGCPQIDLELIDSRTNRRCRFRLLDGTVRGHASSRRDQAMIDKGSVQSRLSHRCRESGTRFLRAFFEPELRAWHGDQPLWKVFWAYGVLASSGLALLYLIALEQEHIVIQQALLILLAGYTAWILVAIWRCAENSPTGWGTLARGLTIAWAANTMLVLAFLQADLVATYMGR
jgi:hypothetical protein